MRFPSSALHLPGSLLLLIAAQIDAQQIPTAIRKMSPDQGEKFFHEYCAFDSTASQQQAALLAPPLPAPKPAVAARQLFDLEDARAIAANSSTPLGPRPPFAPHLAQQPPDDSAWGWELVRRAAEALAGLERRQWECPGGTTACLNIGYPNSCCATEETCFIVTETGFPIVGCCPKGETCGGSVAPCPEGDVSCPASLGGGCCISGFVCQGVGCIASSTSVVMVTTTSTTVISASTPSTVIVTVVITETPAVGVTTSTTTEVVPPSSETTETTSSGGGPAVRPTLTSSTSSTTTEAASTSSGYCPVGFYACVASAGGGCCQTGRGCSTTSCPPLSYTTVVSGGVTVVVPLTDFVTTATGSCASGWSLCGADAGPTPGCCPTGYACGTASCSLVTLGATATVAKEVPGGAGRAELGERWLRVVVLVAAAGWLAVV